MKDSRNEIRRLMIAVNRIDELYYRALRMLKVKDNTFVLFYAISDGKSHSQKQVCEEWLIPRTTLNTVVNECVNKGYIQLVSQGNKEKEIVLTDSGKAFAASILTPIFEAEEKAMEPLLGKGLVEQLECFTERLDSEFQQMKE
ncbi:MULTISPECIES: MarR family winged helix-turn-helix transcriptional regulator [Paenibacillus]|uniref:MarR family winged helix-turn-helix transcriptional regulator n=1 Tax=Paenibacillus TaxID=44249 RepID=UPI0022B89943|nr:MarR family winged helix-turn-helix transcriptional regulator [Paenibacillus caseinilyticus]